MTDHNGEFEPVAWDGPANFFPGTCEGCGQDDLLYPYKVPEGLFCSDACARTPQSGGGAERACRDCTGAGYIETSRGPVECDCTHHDGADIGSNEQCPEACCTPDDPTPEWMHRSGKCPYATTEFDTEDQP
jgi:hypothetical protein